ncbi:unnamed protein product [Toxocara canis]|uniref:Uncharacterized protein n=1 Tax=Toxocara canis TaxID=6265 RepID=A0A183TY04_TOXCA|nr:unnamed protein product [Toxocara canis]
MLDVNFSGGDSHPITRDTARSSSACCGAQSASNAYNANVEKNMRKRKKQCTENMSNAQLVPFGAHMNQLVAILDRLVAIAKTHRLEEHGSGAACAVFTPQQQGNADKTMSAIDRLYSVLALGYCNSALDAVHLEGKCREEITAARDVLCALVCVPLRCTLAALGNAGEISAEMNSICAERSRRSVKTPHLSYR